MIGCLLLGPSLPRTTPSSCREGNETYGVPWWFLHVPPIECAERAAGRNVQELFDGVPPYHSDLADDLAHALSEIAMDSFLCDIQWQLMIQIVGAVRLIVLTHFVEQLCLVGWLDSEDQADFDSWCIPPVVRMLSRHESMLACLALREP